MGMKVEQFGARLNDRLEAGENHIPLAYAPTADLLSLLSEADDYIYLSINDETSYEVVRCRNEGGTLLIERGVEGTSDGLHGFGACVSAVSPLHIAVMKDIACNYNCCEDGDCECAPVAFNMAFLPYAVQGVEWEGMASFSGNLPMTIGVNGAPEWMGVEVEGNTIRMYGTPAAAGSISFSVAATNCNGTNVASHVISLTVAAQKV